jgi:hypothetical protein
MDLCCSVCLLIFPQNIYRPQSLSPSLWIWNWKSQCSWIKITLFSLNKWLIACVLVLIFLHLYYPQLLFFIYFRSSWFMMSSKNGCSELSRYLIYSVLFLINTFLLFVRFVHFSDGNRNMFCWFDWAFDLLLLLLLFL